MFVSLFKNTITTCSHNKPTDATASEGGAEATPLHSNTKHKKEQQKRTKTKMQITIKRKKQHERVRSCYASVYGGVFIF